MAENKSILGRIREDIRVTKENIFSHLGKKTDGKITNDKIKVTDSFWGTIKDYDDHLKKQADDKAIRNRVTGQLISVEEPQPLIDAVHNQNPYDYYNNLYNQHTALDSPTALIYTTRTLEDRPYVTGSTKAIDPNTISKYSVNDVDNLVELLTLWVDDHDISMKIQKMYKHWKRVDKSKK